MSRPITDAQIYGLMWARSCAHGAFSELHDPPYLLHAPDGRMVRLFRTAFDRPGLLGLGRRGFLREADHGLWAMADATADEQRKLQAEHDEAADERKATP